MNFEAPPPLRKLRRFRPMTSALEGRVPVSSLFPGVSPLATGFPQPVDRTGRAAVPAEIQAREVKPVAVEPAAPLPATGVRAVSTTIGETGRFQFRRTTVTIDARPTASSDPNDMATDPVFAMAGSGSGSSSHEGPALSPPASQPQARAGAVNSNTHPPAPTPSPQPTTPNGNAGAIRPLYPGADESRRDIGPDGRRRVRGRRRAGRANRTPFATDGAIGRRKAHGWIGRGWRRPYRSSVPPLLGR